MAGSDSCTTVRMHLTLRNGILTNGKDGQFYVMCFLPLFFFFLKHTGSGVRLS